MHELFLLLLLFVAPVEAEAHAVPVPVAAEWPPADPCAAARLIAEQGACTRPEDCGAFEGWMRLFGEPRTEPLDPKVTRRPIRPRAFPCPAQPAPGGARKRGP